MNPTKRVLSGAWLGVFVTCSFISVAFGRAADQPPKLTPEEWAKLESAATRATLLEIDRKNGLEFMGISFGVGLAGIALFRKDIQQASIAEGKVVIDEEKTAYPTVLFETHFLPFVAGRNANGNPASATGPFVCILASSEKALDALGVGWMFGFRQGNSSNGINLGLAYMLLGSRQALRDDFVAGKPAPAGATEVKFKKTSSQGLALVVSFSM